MKVLFVAGVAPIVRDGAASRRLYVEGLGLPLEGDRWPAAAAELAAKGHRLLTGVKTEPWGQVVARLLSPEGLLLGLTSTPWMRGG